MDCDAALHRATFLDVLADAGLDPALAEALERGDDDSADDGDQITASIGQCESSNPDAGCLRRPHAVPRKIF